MLDGQILIKNFTWNKSKHLLVENKFQKLKTIDSSYFVAKSLFDEDGTQRFLVFDSILKIFLKDCWCR